VSDDQLDRYVRSMIDAVNAKAKVMVNDSPHTLFVFAAGNDGASNDDMPMAPANLGMDSTISVAATLGVHQLASFSNFGKTVDVAAPGVAVDSTVPGDQHMQLSGTSMAAPFVTEAAALAHDANPKLTPAEIKKLLIGTVDVKDFLKDKVASSGVVNPARAKAAAKLATTMDLDQAIAQAKTAVADQVDSAKDLGRIDDRAVFVAPLPSPIHL
jgi:subtilisin family serine protease